MSTYPLYRDDSLIGYIKTLPKKNSKLKYYDTSGQKLIIASGNVDFVVTHSDHILFTLDCTFSFYKVKL